MEAQQQESILHEMSQRFNHVNDMLVSSPLYVDRSNDRNESHEHPLSQRHAAMVMDWMELGKRVGKATQSDWIQACGNNRKKLIAIRNEIDDAFRGCNDRVSKVLLTMDGGMELHASWQRAQGLSAPVFARNGAFEHALESLSKRPEYVLPVRMKNGECYYAVLLKRDNNQFDFRRWVPRIALHTNSVRSLPPLMNITVRSEDVNNLPAFASGTLAEAMLFVKPAPDAGNVFLRIDNTMFVPAVVEWRRSEKGKLEKHVVLWLDADQQLDGHVSGVVDVNDVVNDFEVPLDVTTLDNDMVNDVMQNQWNVINREHTLLAEHTQMNSNN